jgi:AmmeMemoRadiSam system protein B
MLRRETTVRPSPLAGHWYPGNANQLTRMVDDFLGEAVTADKPLYGLLAPHAGLYYSGPVAGKAFRHTYHLDVTTVVIVAPSHHLYPAALLSTAHSHFETPLGYVPVATDLIEALEKNLKLLRVSNDPEHAIEIELPFLQRTLGNFRLLPLALIDQSWPASQKLGEVLAGVIAGEKVLLVASSDLSHFYTQAEANQLDKTLLEAVSAYQPERVIQLDEEGHGFACGRGAIAAVMVAAGQLGATTATIVGYGAALFN